MNNLIFKDIGITEYVDIWQQMKLFATQPYKYHQNEIWFTEHYPVYTAGISIKTLPNNLPSNIPVIHSDRGGKITYHGPGQLIAYTMLNVKSAKTNIRDLVTSLEKATISLLHKYNIDSYSKRDAPGVYTKDSKIASLGLKIKNGRTYHGIALNVCMDLSPYNFIDPCGYHGLQVTHMAEFIPNIYTDSIKEHYKTMLFHQLQNFY